MILKFKNKYLMTMDKLIKEGDDIGGNIESIVLDPKEGAGLILEIIKLGAKYARDIAILDGDGNDLTRSELIWGGSGVDRNEHVKELVNRWYKIQIAVTYKDIPLCIVKPKPDVPRAEKAVGWSEPKAKQIEDEIKENIEVPKLTDVISSWKLYDETPKEQEVTGIQPPDDVLPPITKEFMDSQNIPPPPPPPPRSVRGAVIGDKASQLIRPMLPPNRLIVSEPWVGICDKCGSSKKTKWVFLDTDKCIQPECENYWDKKK